MVLDILYYFINHVFKGLFKVSSVLHLGNSILKIFWDKSVSKLSVMNNIFST